MVIANRKDRAKNPGGPVTVYMPFERIDLVDQMRGDLLTRSKFINYVVGRALEGKDAKTALLAELSGSHGPIAQTPADSAHSSSDSLPRAAPEEVTAT